MAECGTDARVHMVFTGKARNRVTLLQICVRVVSGRWDCCVLGHLISVERAKFPGRALVARIEHGIYHHWLT